ncbi:hypothetical protein B5K05_23310 [Rhizobium phaseoli]|nr:hypothetical protein RPHASCH2410_PD03890 [Rhizobium phaseoli Ch24-10]RDJ04989.1 hypothetical protein B5K04_23250 [Rhizobium phaseoli]RDJ07231.1 hypothetical protein B5K05_23310 [Rhizobium phaseoli]
MIGQTMLLKNVRSRHNIVERAELVPEFFHGRDEALGACRRIITPNLCCRIGSDAMKLYL